MKKITHTLAFAGAAMICSQALCAPIDLVVDPARSSLDMSITLDVSIASDTDNDSSTLSGNIEIELDDAGNPTQISLDDMMVVIDQTMNFNWSFGFFGSADATLTGGSVSYATPGLATGPVPVDANAFSFPEVLVDLDGQLNANYDIFLAGSGSEMVNLGDQGSFASPFNGSVLIEGETITVTSSLPIDVTQPLLDSSGNQLGTVIASGSATIVAVGTAPSCQADLNGDGVLNFFDVSAFLNAFSAMDSAADFNNDGVFNFFDVSAFLNAFTGGCP